MRVSPIKILQKGFMSGDAAATSRFAKTASAYAKFRPSYPSEIVERISEYAKLKKTTLIVDIGCGTGLSTRIFANNGFTNVIGVEPNAAMLESARADKSAEHAIEYRQGDALKTGLDSDSVSLIVCAQAMHWFDWTLAFEEWKRVLRDDGACAGVWNFRAMDGWQGEYENLLETYSTEVKQVRMAQDSGDKYERQLRAIDSVNPDSIVNFRVENNQHFDWDSLWGRVMSSSFVVHGISDMNGFEREVRRIYEANSDAGGQIVFRNITYVLLWRFK